MLRIEHREEGSPFAFVEYRPEAVTSPLPLIVQLHGAGERGNGEDELARVDIHGFSHLLKEKDVEAIVVLPQCPKDTFWAAHVESILRFIGYLKQTLPVDADRVCLTGLSMGGFGTWFTAMAKPSEFAAIAPVCGGGMPWNAGVLTMPIRVFHGAEDKVVSPRHSDEMVERLQELKRDVFYARMEGVGHNVWTYAYGDELMDWLLKQKR